MWLGVKAWQWWMAAGILVLTVAWAWWSIWYCTNHPEFTADDYAPHDDAS